MMDSGKDTAWRGSYFVACEESKFDFPQQFQMILCKFWVRSCGHRSSFAAVFEHSNFCHMLCQPDKTYIAEDWGYNAVILGILYLMAICTTTHRKPDSMYPGLSYLPW